MNIGDRVCLAEYESVRGFIESFNGDTVNIRLDSGYNVVVATSSLEQVTLYVAHSADWLRSLKSNDPRKPRLE